MSLGRIFSMDAKIGARSLMLVTVVGALAGACGGSEGPVIGADVYRQPLSDGNTFTCDTCHALREPATDGMIRPGHAIGDAAMRASYKNGQLSTLRDAVNTCVTEWMNAEAFAESDARWVALSEFLQAEAGTAPAEELSFEIVEPPADVSGGDPTAGEALFNQSCAICHGLGGGGTDRAPGIAGLALEQDYVARRIRTSGAPNSPTYSGLTGGRMPFWSADRLSDDQVKNLSAFVNTSSAAEEMISNNPNDPDPTGRTCGSTHPKVGQTGEFQNFFHDIAGTARVIDDCTIEVTNFGFDGGGIDVRMYGATNGNYDQGFSISGNLRRPEGYSGDTLTLTIPEGRTLDDIDGISVWCVPVGVDFGSATFR